MKNAVLGLAFAFMLVSLGHALQSKTTHQVTMVEIQNGPCKNQWVKHYAIAHVYQCRTMDGMITKFPDRQ